MKRRWVWLVVGVAFACQGKGGGSAAPAASGASSAVVAVASVAAAPASAQVDAQGVCSAKLDYLVPLQKYSDGDLIRALAVDAEQVFYRNMDATFRVPLKGGEPTNLGKAPGLSLSGTTVLWTSGDKLLTQSSGEPIFMSAAKTGGEWSNLINLTADKHSGGRDVATRVLSGLGKRGSAKATRAYFDGETFFWSEIKSGKGANAPSQSELKSIALSGGEPRTLYRAAGEIVDVTRAGAHVAFQLTEPATPEQIQENEAKRKKQKYVFGVRGESHVMSVPLAGGEAKKLLRIGPLIGGLARTTSVLGSDGQKLYVSGYRDEDPQKPGTFRVDVTDGSIEAIDRRVVHGAAFVSGDTLVIIGGGMIEPGTTDFGQLVLTAPRQGTSLALHACAARPLALHAAAVSGKLALLSVFDGTNSTAGIAKVLLP